MRIKASYTVENAVIVPMFMIIIMIMLRLCCDMHDELIKASVNSQVVVQTELNDFGKDDEEIYVGKAEREFTGIIQFIIDNIRDFIHNVIDADRYFFSFLHAVSV